MTSLLAVLDARIADAIVGACDRLVAGELREQFVTDFIPGGAGTSRHMNANEVIANVALEHLDHKKGRYQYFSPNDYVNFGRSTNVSTRLRFGWRSCCGSAATSRTCR